MSGANLARDEPLRPQAPIAQCDDLRYSEPPVQLGQCGCPKSL